MSGIVKKAYINDTTNSGFGSGFGQGRYFTFGDVYNQIREDKGLSLQAREETITGVKAVTGVTNPNVPLAAGFLDPAAAFVANIAARHLKLGPLGTAVMTVAGLGLGKKMRKTLF
jgi:hypothetical protein